MDLGVRLLYMLSLLAVGVGARRAGVLRETRRDRLTSVAFYLVLPSLIFTSTYDRALQELFSVELVAGLLIVILILIGIGWGVHRRTESPATRSVALVQSYHSNFGYLGLPLVAATLGAAAAGKASVILGIGALIQTPITIFILVSMNDADASLAHELRSVVTNPVLISLACGLTVAALSLSVPATVTTGLGWVAQFALPLALILVGSSLELQFPEESDLQVLGNVVALKVFLMPVVAWLAFTALGAEPLTRNAAVVMFGAPTAISTFIYATELGGDAEFSSVTIFVTTVVSVGTLGVVLQLLL